MDRTGERLAGISDEELCREACASCRRGPTGRPPHQAYVIQRELVRLEISTRNTGTASKSKLFLFRYGIRLHWDGTPFTPGNLFKDVMWCAEDCRDRLAVRASDFSLVFGDKSSLADCFVADATTARPHRDTTHKTLPGYRWNWWRREHITISIQQQPCSMMWFRRAWCADSHFTFRV